ncbi:MAG: thermonuclease family protein [Solirubrobacteraceae bacterium]|nr:thermonuclease family protein [Solirubrobacteraceae bacterium]
MLALASTAAGGCSGADAEGGSARSRAAASELPPARAAARVIRVVDGDTLKIRLGDGRRRSVRLIGIDTPETVKPGTPVQCGGPEASAAMRVLAYERTHPRVKGRAVTLVADPTQDRADRYGRLLAYVESGGRDLGRSLVEQGWARVRVYAGRFARLGDYRGQERRARGAGRGVWGRCG